MRGLVRADTDGGEAEVCCKKGYRTPQEPAYNPAGASKDSERQMVKVFFFKDGPIESAMQLNFHAASGSAEPIESSVERTAMKEERVGDAIVSITPVGYLYGYVAGSGAWRILCRGGEPAADKEFTMDIFEEKGEPTARWPDGHKAVVRQAPVASPIPLADASSASSTTILKKPLAKQTQPGKRRKVKETAKEMRDGTVLRVALRKDRNPIYVLYANKKAVVQLREDTFEEPMKSKQLVEMLAKELMDDKVSMENLYARRDELVKEQGGRQVIRQTSSANPAKKAETRALPKPEPQLHGAEVEVLNSLAREPPLMEDLF